MIISTLSRRRTGAAFAAAVLALATLAGCGDDDPSAPTTAPVLEATPQLLAEPDHTGGTSNTIAWSMDPGAPTGLAFRVQAAPEPSFTPAVTRTLRTESSSATFDDLADGTTWWYRVQARTEAGAESAWSVPVASTQDATPPAATLAPLAADQTSLLFDLEITAHDFASGVDSVRLWVRHDAGDLVDHGLYATGAVRFTAEGGGHHAFFVQAIDRAGNVQPLAAVAQAETQVPEPIILVDNTGYEWDVTNAVLKHLLHPTWWAHGLGRFTIRPVNDPLMVGPGAPDYPSPDNIADVIGLNFDGDVRAYRINDLVDREVVNDVVDGRPVAGTY